MRATLAVFCVVTYAFAVANARNNELFGVMGGKKVKMEKRPYNVAVVNTKSKVEGGGVLINHNWVLTAARNIIAYSRNASDLHIRVGSANAQSGGSLLDVEEIITHPMFKIWQYDIGLVKLATPVKITSKTKPIPLAKSLPKENANVMFSGYGNTMFAVETDGILREASLSLIPFDVCKKLYDEITVLDTNFCASKPGVGPCPLDWGGPLVYNHKLIGIFAGSFTDCDNPDHPGVFTDVTKFSEWIQEIIEE